MRRYRGLQKARIQGDKGAFAPPPQHHVALYYLFFFFVLKKIVFLFSFKIVYNIL